MKHVPSAPENPFLYNSSNVIIVGKKVKISPEQAMEAYRDVKR
jgi:hypothetical protein